MGLDVNITQGMEPIDPDFMREIERSLLTMFGYAAKCSEGDADMQKKRIADLAEAEEVMDRIAIWLESWD